MQNCLMWFREDLRIADNTALYHARQQSKGHVIAIVVISYQAWQAHDVAKCRIDFWLRNLKSLAHDLAKLNIPLLIEYADGKDIPKILLTNAQRYHCVKLFFNQQYEVNEARRDQAVAALFKEQGLLIQSYTDNVMVAPSDVVKPSGGCYTVFTPFKRAWLTRAQQVPLKIWPKPSKQQALNISTSVIPENLPGINTPLSANLWPAGEVAAHKRLDDFINHGIKAYHQLRDFPANNGTSGLSPYLSAGIISPRQCLAAALKLNNGQFEQGHDGILVWINELIWREFYKYILFYYPRVSMGRAFKLSTEKIVWQNNSAQFKAWQAGLTGYPLIDAAMRQLKTIGWMHNRLRMLTAMFLVKDLLIDWRWGERYFMQQLIDGDLAANNGGWQWAASTGTDAVPYFRIFNPITQSQKFDPNGDFIRRYCPELASLSNKEIHDPSPVARAELNYPMPIINHREARLRALQAYKNKV